MASSCCNNDSSKESAPKEGKNASLPTTTCCTSSADTQRGKADQARCCTTSELAGTSLQTEPSESPPNDTETCCSKVPLEKVNPDDASCCASSSPGSASNLATRATYTYRIEGMDCPSCAATLEKGLATIPEYQHVSVQYGAARLKIDSEEEPDDRRLGEEVRKLGFHLILPDKSDQLVQTFTVSGMDCSSCAKTIEQHFQKMQNVQTVTVSFARGEMEIDHQLDARQVQSELNKIGFDGYVKGKKTSEAPVRSFEGISLILSGILIGLGLLIQTSGVAYLPNVLYGIALILSGGESFPECLLCRPCPLTRHERIDA